MEQKGFDGNFFIGLLLIFGILIWFNLNQISNPALTLTLSQIVPKMK